MSIKKTIAVLISGNGSNLQALIDQAGEQAYRISGVVCNRHSAFGLQRAARAGIPSAIIEHGAFPDRAAFDAALLGAIDRFQADFIVLAGFMRILGPAFIRARPGAILNIHPSLLPKYPGMHTHRRVLAAGDNEHGVSIHFVNEELDGGPIIARSRIAVEREDSEENLAGRIHRLEHHLYPKVVGWLVAGRLELRGDAVYFDSVELPATGIEHPAPAGA